jgi:hypothetical protein
MWYVSLLYVADSRPMPAIHGLYWAAKVTLFHYPKIINLTKRVCSIVIRVDIAAEKARITAAGGFVDFGRVNGI